MDYNIEKKNNKKKIKNQTLYNEVQQNPNFPDIHRKSKCRPSATAELIYGFMVKIG